MSGITINGDNVFFIVGGQRCGTTYLYNLLEKHPSICLAKPSFPHPKYFINQDKKDINYLNYFSKYFKHYNPSNTIFGEVSTSYYEIEQCPEIIASTFPNCKIIFILRNPVERAISNYHFNIDNGIESRSAEDALSKCNMSSNDWNKNYSVDPYNYLARGEYHIFINNYQKQFDKSQIKILYFNEIHNHNIFQSEIYSFLNIENVFHNDKKINKNSSKTEYEIPTHVINFLNNYYKETIYELNKMDCIDINRLITK